MRTPPDVHANTQRSIRAQLNVSVQSEDDYTTQPLPESHALPVAIITMLAIAGVIGIIAVAIKLSSKGLSPDLDNISIGSEVSTISSTTTAEIEDKPDEVRVQ